MKLQTMLANPKTTHVAHALAAIPLPRVDKGREEISGGKETEMAKKHYKHSHDTYPNILKAAGVVRKQLEAQQADVLASNWRRSIGVGILAFREITGDNKKTERYASRYAEMMEQFTEAGWSDDDIVAEVARVTGIELEVEG